MHDSAFLSPFFFPTSHASNSVHLFFNHLQFGSENCVPPAKVHVRFFMFHTVYVYTNACVCIAFPWTIFFFLFLEFYFFFWYENLSRNIFKQIIQHFGSCCSCSCCCFFVFLLCLHLQHYVSMKCFRGHHLLSCTSKQMYFA